MLPELAQKWYKRLKITKRKQGRGCLRSHNNKYCCLGILAEILVEDGVIVREKEKNTSEYYYKLPGDKYSSSGMFNDNILEKIGLSEGDQLEFVRMNDTLGYDFKRIAEEVKTRLIDPKSRA